MVLEDPAAALPPEERERSSSPSARMLARGAGLSLAALRPGDASQGGTSRPRAAPSPGTVFTLTFAVVR